MDDYNFFMNRWINNILVTVIDGSNRYIYTATVKHSQTLSATPLKVWMCCESDGEVMAAHYTCMADVEKFVHILLPSVPFLPLAEIDFRTPQQKRKTFLETAAPAIKKSMTIQKPTEAMLEEHYYSYLKLNTSQSLVSGFNDDFVPLYLRGLLPELLTSLFHKDNQIPHQDLVNACDAFDDMVSLIPEQVHMVELKTREQSKCKLW